MAIQYEKPFCPECGDHTWVGITYGKMDWDDPEAKFTDIWKCTKYGHPKIKEVEGTLH